MKYLFAILIAATLCAVPIAAGAVTASITLDVHQDIDVPLDKLPNDFHVVGQIKSYISAPVLVWHTDGPFTIFGSTITKVDPLNPADPWYNFTADWSLPVGSPGIPYCTVIHLGLLFDVEGANTVINLRGWWTHDGQPMGDTGQVNNGFVPVAGFDVSDDVTGEGLKIRITNGKQLDPPLPPPPGPTPPPFETEILQMDVIGFLPGQAPSPEALSETGAQANWSWVHVNNANGMPISRLNPIYVVPDSFFDVFLSVPHQGQPSLPPLQQIHLQPGGTLVARTLTRFTNNAGLKEERWQWDVHQAPNTVDWRPGNEYKWVQMPDISDTGIDIRCDVNDGTPRVLADDFKCIETGPITDVHFWGSWLNDNKGQIQKIHLSIHKDVPAGGTGTFSHPDNPAVWEADFFVGQFSEKLYKELPTPQHEWWWDPYTNTLMRNGDTQVWQYDIPITQMPFFQTGTPQEPMIYWLDVSVTLNSVLPPAIQPQFGWKTRDWRIENFGGGHFMDDAVRSSMLTPNWMELRYPSEHPQAPNSLDMSFVITGPTRQRDWGDAPDDLQLPRYPTWAIHTGANHGIIPGFCLGNLIDAEGDGQPNANATGDDINPPIGLDDEDGVTFAGPLIAGQNNIITVVASAPGLLDVWVDFGANGSWDPGEQIFANQTLAAGLNALTFFVPAGSTLGQTFARFRFSSTGGLAPTGPANDGEVEDYMVDIQQPPQELDWGDAPDTEKVPRYPTLGIHDGARHIINPRMHLGKLIDAEPDGQPNLNATGDDIKPPLWPNDEDGVVFKPIYAGCGAKVRVEASLDGFLNAWMDFNGDGDWADQGEQIFTNKPVPAGYNYLTYQVPANAVVTQPTFARFRYSSQMGLLSYTGLAQDGEVEDYMVGIRPMPIIVNKAEAKKKLLNTEVVIMRDVVTANFGINGWYFEEPDRWILNTLRPGRWAGIGVLVDQGDPTNAIPPDTAPWVPGDIVSCVGVTTLTPNGELMIQEVASWWEGRTEPLKPLGQNNRNSGGGRFGLQPGLIDDIGGNPPGAAPKFSANLNTVGLLVRLWGNCTRVERDMLGNPVNAWLDDGSLLWDGTWNAPAKPCMGVKVHFPTAPGIPIDVGKYYAATGIMRTSLPTLAGAYTRWLWVVDIN